MGGVTNEREAGFSGACLCGAVRFEGLIRPQLAVHCYCLDCRRSSGTGHGTHLVVRKDAFIVTGDVTFYERAADSGNIVKRGFCGTCGSPVFAENSGMPHLVFPRASLLEDPEIVDSQMIAYGERAPSWDRAQPSSVEHDGNHQSRAT